MKRSRPTGAVRQKPSRTERRNKLKTALSATGLDRKGVKLEEPMPAASAPRQWKDRATAKAVARETGPKRPRTNPRTSTGQPRSATRAGQVDPTATRADRAADARPPRSGDPRPMPRAERPRVNDPRTRDRASDPRSPRSPDARAMRPNDARSPRPNDARGTEPRRANDARTPRADDRPTRAWGGRPARPGDRREQRDTRGPTGRDRRSLSMPRAPGFIDAGGDPRLATLLAQALRDAGEDDVVADSLTHPVHTYPARMHPATARRLVEVVMGDAGDGLLVDPFCGSGTTLVEAREAGLRAFGSDLNPLAVRIASAKTWTASTPRRRQLLGLGREIAGLALAAGKAARRATAEEQPWRGPPGFDPNARNRRLARWFAPHVRRELETIAARIDDVRAEDPELANPLEICLSAVLYKVSSRASDTDPTWVERNVPRGAASRHFAQRVELLCAGLDDLASAPGPIPQVVEDDARALAKRLGPGAAAGVVTSPPYAGTYDYAEQHRLRFDFLGIHHRALDEGEIGARRAWDVAANQGAADRTWRESLAQFTAMLTVILRSGGRAALVVGDSIAGGRAMRADDDIRAVLGPDLSLAAWAWQERPMLGTIERSTFADRSKREHILLLVRK